jgi:hypothetical protein
MVCQKTGEFGLMMQSKLRILRSELSRLQRMRAFVRWTSALCALVTILLWLLVGAFLADWSFNLPTSRRIALLVVWISGGLWTLKKFVWPVICVRETTEEVALIVERQNRIDSDLVAALQFEQPEAKKWGSSRLAEAVVDYVAEFSPSLNVFEGFSYQPLPKRAIELGATLLLVAGSAVAFPGHASAFWNRFLLGSAHYPTKTQIDSIRINGNDVPVFEPRTTSQARIPYGQPITFKVICDGAIPSSGYASLSGLQNDSVNRIDIGAVTGQSKTFAGEVSHVADSFRVRFHFGDAISDPVEVMIVPLPLVEMTWDITPPNYAKGLLKPGEYEGGSRQISVLEGSSAMLNLTCSNKSLKSARLTAGEVTYDLLALSVDQQRITTWTLPPKSSFETITEALKYEIQVTDSDGLSLEAPIAGQIRLKTDRAPRIVASAVTRQVLPTAQPKLDFVAGDDYGVARIVAVVNISREDGRTSRHEVVAKVVDEKDQPLTIVRGQVTIPLSTYELLKGDEVKVTLEVTDWRGTIPGQKGSSEPIGFNLTDLNGILVQTGEEDKKSAKQLDEILRRELGIGGDKK